MNRRRPRRSPAKKSLLRVGPLKNGRLLALHVIQQYDETGRFLSDLLQEADPSHDLSAQERGLAVDIAAGTVRHRRTIDLLLQSQVSRPRSEVEPDLWRILQTGTQQIVYGRTPDHAVVDAMVELTRMMRQPRWAGYVNGVLRNMTRLLSDKRTETASAQGLPMQDGSFRVLQQDVLACPLTQPDRYFGEAFSMPRPIARRWQQRLTWNDLLTAGFHSLRPPRTCLRVNTMRATIGDVTRMLQDSGLAVTPGQFEESLRLESAGRIDSLPGYDEGLWSVQDESAMAAARRLNPQPGERILDLCAAPGGKATHLAELCSQVEIAACDVSEKRLLRIRENAERLGHTVIRTHLVPHDGSSLPGGSWDAALVDVPCSNTGVFARRPEARWRFTEQNLHELTQLQTRLLMTAFDTVRPGGRVLYSTCSIEPEETTELLQSVVASVPAMTLEHEQLILPGQPADGAYIALLRREEDVSLSKASS